MNARKVRPGERRLMRLTAFALGVVVAILGLRASPAWAAFPGRDGDLVVATGSGLELVSPATGAARSICTDKLLCGHPAQPRFSPNGLAITFVDTTSHRPVVIASDGSCLWCLLGRRLTNVTGSDPAFTASGRRVTIVGSGGRRSGLVGVSLTGAGGGRPLVKGPVDGAVWSSRGLVALARGGWIWVGRTGHGKLRRLARGRFPSFSPNGDRLALARDGYVWIVDVASGSERRVVRGAAPAWSPNGRWIAYVAPGSAVELVPVSGGGRHRRLGSVRATGLDWQPVVSSPRPRCEPPKGSTVLASNLAAVVFSHDGDFYGCLKTLGVTRVLQNGATGYEAAVDALIQVRLAGRFAAIATVVGKPPDLSDVATLYDLSTGTATNLADVFVPGSGVDYGLDSPALDSSGFAAWRQTSMPTTNFLDTVSCPSPSLCVAGDANGNILSSSDPTGGPVAWNIAAVSEVTYGISCPSISLCVAAAGQNVLTSTDPSGGSSAWKTITPDPGSYFDSAVSCPSVSLCVIGGQAAPQGGATILTSTNPTGDAGAWSSIALASDVDGVGQVSCPSVSLCVATASVGVDPSAYDGDVLTSTDPTGGASAWTKTTIDQGNPLYAISCPSVSLCVADDVHGNIYTSIDPTGGPSAWRKITVGQGYLGAISCPSVSLCVATSGGDILFSTDPTGGASAWTTTTPDPGYQISAVSCPSISLCVAVDAGGNILTSTAPTSGTNAWTSATVDIPGCAPAANPCVSEQLYVRDDQGTQLLDSTPPGHANSIDNIALDGDSLDLSWTHDGTQQQLQLR